MNWPAESRAVVLAVRMRFTPDTRAASMRLRCQLARAKWTATRDDEQAVSTLTCKIRKYETMNITRSKPQNVVIIMTIICI
jgi:hypothetical protein